MRVLWTRYFHVLNMLVILVFILQNINKKIKMYFI